MKRFIDIVFSIFAIFVFSPLIVLVSIVICAESRSPVLFRQARIGVRGKPFVIYKFRTMRPRQGQGEDGVEGGERITPLGHYLRRSKLDELPQLFNVLVGDMSLVGPRPELARYTQVWPAEDQNIVLSVRPGLTDFASIVFRNEGSLLAAADDPDQYYRTVLVPKKLRLCRFYVRRATVWLDLWLIQQTLAALLGLRSRVARVRLRV